MASDLLKAAWQSGVEWRAAAEKERETDLRAGNPYVSPNCRHRVPPLGLQAAMTRDIGYHSKGFLPDPNFERCFHLSLAYGRGSVWKQQHHITRAICEGAFGLWLPEVWVQAPHPLVGGNDYPMDCYHFRLFVLGDWKMPVVPKAKIKPPLYITWEAYLKHVAELEATQA